MKLSELIRKKEVATATVATPATVSPVMRPSVATVASVAVANDEPDWASVALAIDDKSKAALAESIKNGGAAWMWEIALPDNRLIVAFTPAATLAEVLEWYPNALLMEAIKP